MSRQWQIYIYKNEKCLTITRNRQRSLSLTSQDLVTHPRIAPKIGQEFKNITKYEFNLRLLGKTAIHLMAYFPHLKEISIYGYNESAMDGLIKLYGWLPFRIRRINLDKHLLVRTKEMFDLFTYYYESKAVSLNVKFVNNLVNFNLEFANECMQNITRFKSLSLLKISSPLDYNNFLLISKL